MLQYKLDPNCVHGLAHWFRVQENGLVLSRFTGADKVVISLFSIFHDACRKNENSDPDHGERGGELAAALRGAVFDCDDTQLSLLYRACAKHTEGLIEDTDITVLTCWDADRLDLPRCGKAINLNLLCTDVAKDPKMIKWAAYKAKIG